MTHTEGNNITWGRHERSRTKQEEEAWWSNVSIIKKNEALWNGKGSCTKPELFRPSFIIF